MSKDQKRTLLIAVTFLMIFLCLGATFVLQLRMQSTLESLAALPQQTIAASESAAAALQSEVTGALQDSESLSSLEVSAVAAAQTGKTSTSAKPSTTKTQITTTAPPSTEISPVLVINKNSKKIHSPDCSYVKNMKEENRGEISSEELDSYLAQGYTMCRRCKGYVS